MVPVLQISSKTLIKQFYTAIIPKQLSCSNSLLPKNPIELSKISLMNFRNFNTFFNLQSKVQFIQ